MSSSPFAERPFHPLIVLVAVGVPAMPATLFALLLNSVGKEEPAYSQLPFAVLGVAMATGVGMHWFQLRLDPNAPRAALLPAILASFGASIVGLVVACVWFMN